MNKISCVYVDCMLICIPQLNSNLFKQLMKSKFWQFINNIKLSNKLHVD